MRTDGGRTRSLRPPTSLHRARGLGFHPGPGPGDEMVEWALLRGLPEGEVDQVLALGRRRRFAKREVIWHAGDRAETVHLIRTGRVAIKSGTSMGDVVTAIVLGAGDAAGLVGALASDPFSTTAAVAHTASCPNVRSRAKVPSESELR